MEKLKSWLCVIFIGVVFVGCKHNTKPKKIFKGKKINTEQLKNSQEMIVLNDSIKTIDIPENYLNTIDMSEIVDSCFYVPLETTSKSIIGNINDLKVFDDKIFVMDSDKAKTVFMFDIKGNFIRKIGEKGKGPGEYLFPQDFDIDQTNEEVLIFNGNSSKIYRYNFFGNYLGDISVPVRVISFSLLNSDEILFYTGDYDNEHLGPISNRDLYLIDRKGEIISSGRMHTDYFKNNNMTLSNKSLVSDQVVSFSPKFSDTIFSVDGESISGQYALNFGERSFDRNQVENKTSNEFLRYVNKLESPFFLGAHLQNNNHLYFSFSYKDYTINSFFNKKTNTLIMGKSFRLDRLDYLSSVSPVSQYTDFFVSIINPIDLMNKKKAALKSAEIRDLIKNKYLSIKFLLDLDENDNPIISFCKLKKDF